MAQHEDRPSDRRRVRAVTHRALALITTAALTVTLLSGTVAASADTPDVTPTPTAQSDPSSTPSPAPTPSLDAEPTPTTTPTPTPDPTPAPDPTPTAAPTPDPTPTPDAAPAPPGSIPDEVPLEGLLRVVAVEGPAAEDPDGPDAIVTLVTTDGASVDITGAELDDVVSGTRFEGVVTVPTALALSVERHATVDDIAQGEEHVGELVADAADTASTTLPVVEATLSPPVESAISPRARTVDVMFIRPPGTPAPAQATIDATIARLGEYWKSETNGQVSAITRTSTYRIATKPLSAICDVNSLWEFAAGPTGFNRTPVVEGDYSSYYWAGNSPRHLIVFVTGVSSCGMAIGYGTVSTLNSGGQIWGIVDPAKPLEWDGVLFHEFGHNLSLGHSNTLVCPDPVVDGAPSGACHVSEYSDIVDVMGMGYGSGELTNSRDIAALNVPHKVTLDALPRGSALTEVRSSGGTQRQFTLAPVSSSTGVRGLDVVDPLTGQKYFVEYRSGTGRDAASFYGDLLAHPENQVAALYPPGVRIFRASDTSSTLLQRRLGEESVSGAFRAGDEFVSASVNAAGAAGLRVRVVSTSGSNAVVEVSFDASLAAFTAKPTVTITGPKTYYGLLTATGAAGWTPAADRITYQWRRNGATIAGATSSTYRVREADRGQNISVQVSASRAGTARATVTSAAAAIAEASSPASLSGTVTLPAGASASLREGMRVAAHAIDDGNARFQHVISADVNAATGAYTLTGLGPGEWRVQVIPGSVWNDGIGGPVPVDLASQWYGGAATPDASTSVHVTTPVTGVNFTLTAGRRITGTVTLPAGSTAAWRNAIRVYAVAEHPGDGRYAIPRSGTATLNADGSYTITGLDPGKYKVRFEPLVQFGDDPVPIARQYYNAAISEETATVLDTTTGNRSGVNATLVGTRTISGRVNLPSGAPMSWYQGVRIDYSKPGDFTVSATVAADGTYTSPGLNPGTWRVCAAPADFWDPNTNVVVDVDLLPECWNDTFAPSRSTPVDVVSGDKSGIDFTLARPRTITGTVSLPAGSAAAWRSDVTVYAQPVSAQGAPLYETGSASAPVDPATGAYTLTGLLPGPYRIEFRASGSHYDPDTGTSIETGLVGTWYNGTAAGSLATVGATTVDLTSANRTGVNGGPLRALTKVTGTLNLSALPAGQRTVDFSLVDPTGREQVGWGWVNGTGFEITRVAPGTYRMLLTVSVTTETDTGTEYARSWQYLSRSGSKLLTVGTGATLALGTLVAAPAGATISGSITTTGFVAAEMSEHLASTYLYERMGTDWVRFPERVAYAYDNDVERFTTRDLAAGTYTIGYETKPLTYDLTPGGVGVIQEWWEHRTTLATANAITLAADAAATARHGSVRPVGVAAPPPPTDPPIVDPGPDTPPPATVTRLSGANRYATAVAISKANFAAGVPVVYLANGSNFPDALAGAPVAGMKGGPVLLTPAGSLPEIVATELSRLAPTKIVVLGGTGAVSQAVVNRLADWVGSNVTRLAGAGRYDTAVAISKANYGPGVPVVYLASGTNFPDALAGAPVAGMKGGPALLTPSGALPAVVSAELARLSPAKVVVLGGTGAVSEAVAKAAAAVTHVPVTRLAGSGRYDTAVAISKANFGPGVPVVYIANGTNFPDALAGAPVAGMQRGPVLLTPPTALPAVVMAELARLDPQRIVVLGGKGVVTDAVMAQLGAYLD